MAMSNDANQNWAQADGAPTRRRGGVRRAPLRGLRCVRGGGFTIIEMIVVVVIITLLVSILLPALGSARREARRVKCLVNLRSFGTALQMYMEESKGLLPRVLPLHDTTWGGNDAGLLTVLERYMSVRAPYRSDPSDVSSELVVADVFRCPMDVEQSWKKTGTSYEYWAGSLMIAREIFRADPNPPLSVTKFYEGSRDFPVMADAGQWHRGSGQPRGQNALFYGGSWSTGWLNIDPTSGLGPPLEFRRMDGDEERGLPDSDGEGDR
jgi:prepilin-type N-terminal cleavage/methylation domain-containing protein